MFSEGKIVPIEATGGFDQKLILTPLQPSSRESLILPRVEPKIADITIYTPTGDVTIRLARETQSVDLEEGIAVTFGKTESLKQQRFMEDFLEDTDHEYVDLIGRIVKEKLSEGPASLDNVLEYATSSENEIVNDDILTLIDAFIDTGHVCRTKNDKLKLTKRGKKVPNLGHDEVKSFQIAWDAVRIDYPHKEIETMEDVEDSHKIRPWMQIAEVKQTIEDSSSKVLYLSEILLGNNSSDIKFLGKVMEQLQKLPEEMKPDVIVVSGLMEGSHKFRNKDKRLGLVQGLDQQFASAHIILRELEKTGAKIIYSLSGDDREICRDGTIEAMRIVNNIARPLADREKGSVTYWQQDQLKQNEAWDQNLKFQLNVVFEYCLRSGRRLRSADEIEKISEGKLRIEEYLLLWEVYDLLSDGKTIPESYGKILNIENIPLPGQDGSEFVVADNLKLKIKTSGKNVTHTIMESLKFGDKAMYQNPTDAAQAIQKQLGSEGVKMPEILAVMDQQQAFGIGSENGWVISTPGFTDTKKILEMKGTIAKTGQSSAWRQLTTRRILGEPAATMHELTDDGRHIITIFNAKLQEKADATDRRTIVTFADWQTGSTTARPDLQVKYADMVFNQVLSERPVYLFTGGDIIQGRNYRGMEQENAHIGLVRIEDQQRFVVEMLQKVAESVPAENFLNLLKVGIIPGNHEWNSGYRDNGAIFNLYLIQAFNEIFAKKGITPGKDLIKAYEAVRTDYGDFFKAWTAFEKDVAGYGVLVQHAMLQKGAKGGGNKPPVYQGQVLIEGLADLLKNDDFGIFEHWHHPQYGIFGNKVAIVNPALAGMSGFEWERGFRPVLGATQTHLGGGLPPQIEFLSAQYLHNYEISKGPFSKKQLKKSGFKDDAHFDPTKHGFVDRRSALQKALWNLRDEILFTPHSDIS